MNGVRLVSWNVGSLLKRYHDILALRPAYGVDIVCVQEIGALDPVAFNSLREMRGFRHARLWYCARPGGSGGGVAFIVLNPDLSVEEIGRLSRGGLSIRVRARGYKPFSITNCYFPPAGSPYRDDADCLHAWLPHEFSRIRDMLGIADRLAVADWNARQGCARRHTADSSQASQLLANLQKALNCGPALGRAAGAMAATFTSRAPTSDRRNPLELSEVDGFWCSTDLAPERIGSLLPDDRPMWSHYFIDDGDPSGPRLPGDLTHLPVFLDFQPLAAEAGREQTHPRKHRRTEHYTPVYVDRSWAQRASANIEHLDGVREMAADPQTTLEQLHNSIRNATLAAAKAVHPRTPHAPTAAYRLFQNTAMPTPAPFVNDSVEARRLAAKGKRLCQTARFKARSTAERDTLEAKGKELLRASERLRIRANTLAAGVAFRWRAQLSHSLENARRIDPHALAALVFSELTLADPFHSEPGDAVPQADGEPPPPEYFYRYFRKLTRERRLRLSPGATTFRRFWRQRIPRAPDDPSVTDAVPAQLIYWLVFPPTKRSPPPRCSEARCATCDRQFTEWNAWQPNDPHCAIPPPNFKPSLRASRAAGPDGLRCEDWRWARPAALESRYEYRMELSLHLAAYVNRILAEGRVPEGDFAECVSVPVFKTGKPGQPKPDPALPTNYRDITVGNLLAKLVSLVLTFRLTHWAMRHEMISPEQAAFMPYHSAESHVFVFNQLLRSRARLGKSSRVLFVDLFKAYNRVHLASLWHLLREMNLPARIVDLLDDWAAKRRTRLRVNGELSPEYSMLAGTPQGDPLSCLLFNLYIEPLIRLIKSLATVRGLPIPGTDRVLKALFFADDIAGLSDLSDDDSQLIMDAVMLWCRDWDMEVSTGAGKSETVGYFASLAAARDIHVASVRACLPPELSLDEDVVNDCEPPPWGPWKVLRAAQAESQSDPELEQPPASLAITAPREISDSSGYRYLGWRSKSDISDTLATANLVRTMDSLYLRYFRYNLTIRRCSPALQLQLLHSNVFGPIIYLLSMLSVPSETQSKLDRRARRYCRRIFGLPRGTPNAIVTAISRVNSFYALQSRERARLCLQLASPLLPDKSIAYAVFNGVSGERAGKLLAHANLPVRHARELTRLEGVGVAPPPCSPPHYRIAIEAGLFGDRVALQQWQHEARVASAVQDPPRANRLRRGSRGAPAAPPALKLPRPLPTDHAADLYFDFSQIIGEGPVKHGLVPLSYVGPGGTSIVALSNQQCPIVSVVARLQAGNAALRRFPWRPRCPVRPPPRTGSGVIGADDELSEADTTSSASSDEDDVVWPDTAENDTLPETPSSSPDAPSDAPRRVGQAARRRNSGGALHPTKHAPLRRLSTPGRLQSVTDPRAAAMPCRFCGSGHEHPAHAFFECEAGRLPSLRRALQDDAPRAWERLLGRIENTVLSEYGEPMPEIQLAVLMLRGIYSNPTSMEARWLSHRLLWALPWPARAVPITAVAARALGAIFDLTVLSRHAARPLADSWISWASRWTRRFGEAWSELLASTGHAEALR